MSERARLETEIFFNERITSTDKLAESAVNVALHNFEWHYATLVFFNTTILSGIETFIRLYNKGVITSNGTSKPKLPEEFRQYILFARDLRTISYMLQWMQRYQFNNTGKYIVICQSRIQKECDESETVKLLWDYKIINVVLIKMSFNEDKIMGYTYEYPESDCKSNRVEKINFERCASNKTGVCQMFPLKLLNLHGCMITASTFIQPPYMTIVNGTPVGADGDIIRVIAERLNATLKMRTPYSGDGWGFMDRNGTWSGSLGDVYYDLANLSITSASITLNRFTHFQMSMFYNCINLGWITHPAEKQSAAMKLLYPFKLSTHLAVATTYLFVILIALFIRTNFWDAFRTKMNITHPESSLVYYSWMICMGLSIKTFPKKPVLLYIALFWIWYCFLIRTFYQTSLINSLKEERRYSDLNTIYDLINANYRFGGGNALKDYYIDDPVIYDNWIGFNTPELNATMKKLKNGMKFGLALNLHHAYIFIKKSGPLHILPQKIVVSPSVIYFKKFSPLTESVNHLLRRLVEAGIVDKFYKKYTHVHPRHTKILNINEPINMQHYTGCYVILLFGYFVSSILLIYEICIEKFKSI